MVANNTALITTFTQNLANQTGAQLELLCIPEGAWLTLRENFIRENGLDQKKPVTEQSMESFIAEAQQASQDPLVVEAEKLFGKDFIEVIED